MMASGRSMGSWWFADSTVHRTQWSAAVVAAVALTLSAGPLPNGSAWAAMTEQELAALSRLGEAKGRSADDMKRLLEQAQRAEARGLPSESLLDKIKEGLAKGIDSGRIEQRLATMVSHMEQADALLKETGAISGGRPTPGGRERALEVLGEALERGVTPGEVRAVHRAIGEGGREVLADTLAFGGKGMALMKEGGLPPDESHAMIVTASRRGLDSASLLDLAREIKVRGQELRENPARLREIRQAVERGERLEKILGDIRPRQDTTRSERFERRQRELSRPERRPERPERPLRPHGR